MSIYDGLRNLEPPRRPRRPVRRAVRVGVIAVVIAGLFFSGAGMWALQKVNGALDKARDRSIQTDTRVNDDEPLNILVVGSDRREGVINSKDVKNSLGGPSGQRADTIILIHISAKANKAVAVSLPRDLRVKIPGRSGYAKINSTYAGRGGGPSLLIKTVNELTGLRVHNYVEVNFNSFRSIVQAVGGVRICVTRAMKDRKAGLNIPRKGCHELGPDMALAYVRARNIDPTADIGRIQRQQQFMRALMAKVKSVGFIFNPGKVQQLADAISGGLKVDENVDLGLIRGIAGKLGGSQKNVDFRIVPGTPRYIGGVSYVVPDEEQAAALFTAMAKDAELPPFGKTSASLPKPEDVTLKISNGSGINGLARSERVRLRAEGFTVLLPLRNSDPEPVTRIVYTPGAELKAELLQGYYPGAKLEVATESIGSQTDCIVYLGQDRKAATASPAA